MEEQQAKAAAKAEAIEKGEGGEGAVDLEADNESKASKRQPNNVEWISSIILKNL